MPSYLISGVAASNNMGDSGSGNGGRDSYTSDWSVAAGLRRRRGNAKPMKR